MRGDDELEAGDVPGADRVRRPDDDGTHAVPGEQAVAADVICCRGPAPEPQTTIGIFQGGRG